MNMQSFKNLDRDTIEIFTDALYFAYEYDRKYVDTIHSILDEVDPGGSDVKKALELLDDKTFYTLAINLYEWSEHKETPENIDEMVQEIITYRRSR